jgi:RHH-type proline utilization regulon transcriptional repressor/proline dehydrogenase/delta 1-pyrroline-5-carboxylate dehydrogenase
MILIMLYSFSKYLYQDENQAVDELLGNLYWPDGLSEKVRRDASALVNQVRTAKSGGGQMEKFFQDFSLNTDEGLAMMCLAEALLRVPDAATANALIKDKVAAATWLNNQGDGPRDWMTKAAGLGMALSRKTLDSALSKLGQPIIRESMVRAMQIMGKQFVLGTSIENAISNSKAWEKQGYRMSYDMLGEGARDMPTAEGYFQSYSHSIEEVSKTTGQDLLSNAGISVKLSALHPRYEYSQKERCIPILIDRLKQLCAKAAAANMPLTIDAEEADRLDLSMEVFDALLHDPDLDGWDGLGMAVQAYQKRGIHVIKYIASQAREAKRVVQIRLVKGAYWDSEIKEAQVSGMTEYPVFTRKCNTDLAYLVCAQEMLVHGDVIYPMFATHNVHSIAAIRNMAKEKSAVYEFQRLYGMGEGIYAHVISDTDVKVSVYAPVGPHKDLLPYLVRRLLENGANSSFVNKLLDESIDSQELVRDPVKMVQSHSGHRHPQIPLPRGLFGQKRLNSLGVDMRDDAEAVRLRDFVENYSFHAPACSYVSGKAHKALDEGHIDRAFTISDQGFIRWSHMDVNERADIIERCADALEHKMDEFIAVLVLEAGKTYDDAIDEVREAVDFCRYYAQCARKDFSSEGIVMPGYTGESNRLTMHGRGTFVCISPWNFPLAIFTGQIVAALLAGNAVIAKPASQTRYVASYMVELMLKAGVPKDVLHLLLGDGAYGGQIVADRRVSGVVFTGSTATAKRIQGALYENNDAIIPFIAETGGQNAMIVDSTALPEQVVDDVIHSAFGSAGQRCSALRVLYVQDDIADNVLEILRGAIEELEVNDPMHLSTDIGYIIDEDAKKALDSHINYIEGVGERIAVAKLAKNSPDNGRLFAPAAYEIDSISVLKEEVFGPVLHVIRFKATDLGEVIDQINSSGYGLTFGLHSRIQARHERISKAVNAGNIYVNRSMTGAIVGVQPFGGMGLSGTGPKAGGPHYLHAFAVEKNTCIDTTANGGNASLVSLDDE